MRDRFVLFLSVLPILFASEVVQMVLILELVASGSDRLPKLLYHDWRGLIQFIFVVASMFGIRALMQKVWPVRGEAAREKLS